MVSNIQLRACSILSNTARTMLCSPCDTAALTWYFEAPLRLRKEHVFSTPVNAIKQNTGRPACESAHTQYPGRFGRCGRGLRPGGAAQEVDVPDLAVFGTPQVSGKRRGN